MTDVSQTKALSFKDRSMVFQVAYLRFLEASGKSDSPKIFEAFRAGWAAHDKARAGHTRPLWAVRSLPVPELPQ